MSGRIAEIVFDCLERCAVNGERCPQTGDTITAGIFSLKLESSMTTALARAGRIRVELFGHNWRVVTILEGPHHGMQTAPCPIAGSKVYLTVGRETVRNGRALERKHDDGMASVDQRSHGISGDNVGNMTFMRVCLAGGCYERVFGLDRFCERHAYKRPENFTVQMVGAR